MDLSGKAGETTHEHSRVCESMRLHGIQSAIDIMNGKCTASTRTSVNKHTGEDRSTLAQGAAVDDDTTKEAASQSGQPGGVTSPGGTASAAAGDRAISTRATIARANTDKRRISRMKMD